MLGKKHSTNPLELQAAHVVLHGNGQRPAVCAISSCLLTSGSLVEAASPLLQYTARRDGKYGG